MNAKAALANVGRKEGRIEEGTRALQKQSSLVALYSGQWYTGVG